MEEEYKGMYGIQKKACELVGIKPSSFSKWKNKNLDKYLEINKDITKKELDKAKVVIKKEFFP